jgi:hypothetical protein
MLIPKQVKIGAHTFDIARLGGLPVDDNFGKMQFESLEIFIRNDVPQSQQEETLIHEAYHAIRRLSGFEMKDDDQEEQHVQAIGHLLYLFLKENKLLK